MCMCFVSSPSSLTKGGIAPVSVCVYPVKVTMFWFGTVDSTIILSSFRADEQFENFPVFSHGKMYGGL